VAFVLPNIKCEKEGKEFFGEKSAKVYISKIAGTKIWPGICYLLNGFQNPASKSTSCWIEKFPARSEKNLLDLAAKQLKWQYCQCPHVV